MADEKQGKGTIAILGATAVAVVLALLGVLYWSAGPQKAETSPAASAVQPPVEPQKQAAAAPAASSQPPSSEPARPASTPAQPAKPAPETKGAAAPIAPSFDIVRVEPTGDSVIAGRAAPGATIELLSDDQVHARGVADASGLFAITPPPLPPGSHLIILQSIAPDGTRQRSRESVTVAINGNSRPLVALAAPDKPTVLLSNPEPPTPKPVETPPAAPAQEPAKQAATASNTPETAAPAAPPAQPAPRADIKIMSVETEPGRLYVSGQAAPGATVRLYLNETFVAPGGAGADGKLSFAIASGVRSGDYRVRLDDVDPVSGQVKSRAEVGFNVPPEAAPQIAQGQAVPAAPAVPLAAKPGPATSSGAPAVSDSGAAPVVVPQPGMGNRLASALPDSQFPANTVVVPNINTAIVSRGDSLWRISQRIYGRGMRYTVIYGANQKQIRDPDLIYPGQLFVLPSDQAKGTN
ncbi:LysM peptidoglycan-binding domain-containing protein [Microvirga rosea]|uniref:LysM peptidoglycan-binding domain-containing protein n=1 Tax=Microvirga rosea TaxID=2715425 RepID=UPI001D0BC811|nr:LysM peptidoglycan-binding domain-containing protein [Microvirga rosea]MCB8819973.1 LysM peptidoglycan-binding domain-containing protein [Microvirga rosea]